MKFSVISILLVVFITGCTAKKQRVGRSTMTLDNIYKVKIATKKGPAFAGKQAKEACGRSKKSPVLTGSKKNYFGSTVVYSYDCK